MPYVHSEVILAMCLPLFDDPAAAMEKLAEHCIHDFLHLPALGAAKAPQCIEEIGLHLNAARPGGFRVLSEDRRGGRGDERPEFGALLDGGNPGFQREQSRLVLVQTGDCSLHCRVHCRL
jgi:hypothetical protein